jgi:hypothetical protein
MTAWQTWEGRAAKFVAILTLVPALVGLCVLPFDQIAGMLIAIIGSGACLLSVPILYAVARLTARKINSLRGGEGLLRWSYDWDEWRAFAAREYAVSRRVRGIGSYALMLSYFAIVAITLLLLRENPAAFNAVLFIFGVIPAMFMVIGLVARAFAKSAFRRAHRVKEDVVIDQTGVLYNGHYYWWGKWGTRVENATIVDGAPAFIEVKTSQRDNSGGRTYNEFRFPIPHEKMYEAQAVVRWLLGGR